MSWGRKKPEEKQADALSAAVVLARLDVVVDRLEGVYDKLVPLLPPKEAS